MVDSCVKIIVEKNIPYFKGFFDEVADVEYLKSQDITPQAVADADALVTRTRTRCNSSLLDGSKVKIVASATIGLDHVDVEWCRSAGIVVENAPGCNAPAVAQYVFGSLLMLLPTLRGKVIGIVGVGNVGRIVEQWARQLGMTVLLNDPPRAAVEGADGFVSLDEIARRADIITYHTPYTITGKWISHHLCDKTFIDSLERKPIVVNCARGGVTDTAALIYGLDRGLISDVVIDCWEGEPEISNELLTRAAVATPHIAGYSIEGKIRASRMAATAVARNLHLPLPDFEPLPYLPSSVTEQAISGSYSPATDTKALKANPDDFEKLRNEYNLRTELK